MRNKAHLSQASIEDCGKMQTLAELLRLWKAKHAKVTPASNGRRPAVSPCPTVTSPLPYRYLTVARYFRAAPLLPYRLTTVTSPLHCRYPIVTTP